METSLIARSQVAVIFSFDSGTFLAHLWQEAAGKTWREEQDHKGESTKLI